MPQTVVIVVGWLLPITVVEHGVDFVETVGADKAWNGAEVTVNAERVALAVQVRQSEHDSHHPRRQDHFHRPRLAREDFGVDRVNHGVEPVPAHTVADACIQCFFLSRKLVSNVTARATWYTARWSWNSKKILRRHFQSSRALVKIWTCHIHP